MKLITQKGFKIFFEIAARIVLGGVFAASGMIKLLEPAANFRATLYQYEIIPTALVPALAAVLPWMEWILGVFILAGYALRSSAFVLGSFSFSLAAVIALSGKLGLDPSHTCGCFGEGGPQLSYRQIFSLDITNGFFGFFLWKCASSRLSLDRWLKPASK